MGTQLFDQYTLLHMAVGIIVYFWGIDLLTWTLWHVLFELVENTPIAVELIDRHITWWPGGKKFPDSPLNSFGDILGGAIGWLIAMCVDQVGYRYKWYPTSHIKRSA